MGKKKKVVEEFIELEVDCRMIICVPKSGFEEWAGHEPFEEREELIKGFATSLMADLEGKEIHKWFYIDSAELLSADERE